MWRPYEHLWRVIYFLTHQRGRDLTPPWQQIPPRWPRNTTHGGVHDIDHCCPVPGLVALETNTRKWKLHNLIPMTPSRLLRVNISSEYFDPHQDGALDPSHRQIVKISRNWQTLSSLILGVMAHGPKSGKLNMHNSLLDTRRTPLIGRLKRILNDKGGASLRQRRGIASHYPALSWVLVHGIKTGTWDTHSPMPWQPPDSLD